MKTYSIEKQIGRRIIVVTGLILFASAILADRAIVTWLNHEFDEDLRSKVEVLETLTEDTPNGVDFDFADEFMPEFSRTVDPEYFQLWTDQYHIFERSQTLGSSSNLPHTDMVEVGQQFSNIILPDGREGRMLQAVFLPQIPEDEDRTLIKLASQKPMVLAVAVERESLDHIISLVYVITIIGIIIILGLLVVVVILTLRKGLAPLRTIKEQIIKLNADTLSSHLEIDSPPYELEDVISQFNNLLNRLGKSFSREKQFSSDVAHELRTPISEIRTMSEVALKWPEDINLVREYYIGIFESSKRMQRTVDSMLALARCENGLVNLEPKEFMLKEFVTKNWWNYREAAAKKDLALVCNIPGDIMIATSETELEIVLQNLFSNAVSYSTNGSEINISIKKEDDRITLFIQNKTQHLSASDTRVMFDRLWRKSKSRTSSEHVGIGLSLVKAYSQVLGIEVYANFAEPDVLTINITGIQYIQ